MLKLVQGYRGFAACLVVLYHANGAARAYFGEAPLLHMFDFGWAGVQFFFVLSGFIILHIHRRDIGRPASVLPYLRKRAARIYPPYILVTLALAPAWFLVPAFGEPYNKEVGSLIFSLLLIPQPHPPDLGVAWTLIHEVIFYGVFAALIVNLRAGLILLGAWFGAVAIANLMGPLAFPATYFLSANNLLFGFGMLVALSKRDFGWPVFLAGNVGFIAVGLMAGMEQSTAVILVFGLCSASILLCARKLDGAFHGKAVQALGDASYSIYLVHYPVISIVCKLVSGNVYVAFVACTVAGVAGGLAFHRLIERPLLHYFAHGRASMPGTLLIRRK